MVLARREVAVLVAAVAAEVDAAGALELLVDVTQPAKHPVITSITSFRSVHFIAP
jgi:hypothetical protein